MWFWCMRGEGERENPVILDSHASSRSKWFIMNIFTSLILKISLREYFWLWNWAFHAADCVLTALGGVENEIIAKNVSFSNRKRDLLVKCQLPWSPMHFYGCIYVLLALFLTTWAIFQQFHVLRDNFSNKTRSNILFPPMNYDFLLFSIEIHYRCIFFAWETFKSHILSHKSHVYTIFVYGKRLFCVYHHTRRPNEKKKILLENRRYTRILHVHTILNTRTNTTDTHWNLKYTVLSRVTREPTSRRFASYIRFRAHLSLMCKDFLYQKRSKQNHNSQQ